MARLLRVETVDFDTSYATGHRPHSASLHFLLLVMLREAHQVLCGNYAQAKLARAAFTSAGREPTRPAAEA